MPFGRLPPHAYTIICPFSPPCRQMGLGKTIQVRGSRARCAGRRHLVPVQLPCCLSHASCAPAEGLKAALVHASSLSTVVPTFQVIALACHLVREAQAAGSRQPRPFLIAVPASVLPNWEAELRRWAPGLKVRSMHPPFLAIHTHVVPSVARRRRPAAW